LFNGIAKTINIPKKAGATNQEEFFRMLQQNLFLFLPTNKKQKH
jgi:hypothetical protein